MARNIFTENLGLREIADLVTPEIITLLILEKLGLDKIEIKPEDLSDIMSRPRRTIYLKYCQDALRISLVPEEDVERLMEEEGAWITAVAPFDVPEGGH